MSHSYVRNTGLVCPVGLTAPMACAAIRCDIKRVEELDIEDAYGEPYYVSAMPDIPPTVGARERILTLLARTVLEAAAPLAYTGRVAVVLALPVLLTDAPLDRWWSELAPQFASTIEAGRPRVLFGGPICAFEALAAARELLASGTVDACVVAAADSMVTARRILELAQQGRLQRLENPDGVTPGEAAACVVLDRYSHGALAALGPVGFGSEPATLWNDEPHRADGLVRAVEAALTGSGYALADIDARASDAAGESFDFREQTLLLSRMLDRRKSTFPLLLPGRVLGDVGVAGPLCTLVNAVAAYQRRYAAGPTTLVLARDHQGPRGAILVHGAVAR